ncbi:hypothetical protein Pelo_5525 [Pelomyxa schiedti]|nr:hypothetical protein Pelo_5525 [Pelomyxa schiedti]
MEQVASVAAVTTRSQLGALAAGATISRCGANSAMVGAMGHGHATSLVRMLWSGWVRPTIRFFVIDARGFPSGATVSFALSPLLLSVALAPACFDVALGSSWVDSNRFAYVRFGGDPYLPGLWVGDLRTLRCGEGGVAVARGRPGEDYVYQANSKWAAMVSYTSSGNPGHAALTVASLKSVDDHTGMEFLRHSVVVEMPFVESSVPVRFQLYFDKSVDSEVIVVQCNKRYSSGNRADIFVVDMEQTHSTKSLTILSTTTCMFPAHYFESLVVLRNWLPRSPDYGSRSFFVNAAVADGVFYSRNTKMCRNELFHVEESTGKLTHVVSHMVDVFRVCDSLVGVSFRANKEQELIKFYHRDDPTIFQGACCSNHTKLWVWRLNSGLPVGQCVKLEIDRICRLRVRFQPFGDDDHVVVVTWDVDSELLVVDLQRSFGSGSLTITKTVALPIGRALDVLCLPCGENITLHDTGGVFTVYHTGTKQPVVLKGGIVEFIQPSHVCVSRGLCGMIYSVSDMGSLQLHLQISMHRLLKELSVFGQEETGDTSISYRFHDVVTGKELFVLTRTLPNRSTGKTQLEQHFCISRPPSPPWPTSSPLWD